MNLSETGCRIRSLILFDRGRKVEFELKRQDGQPLRLRGTVVARANPPQGGGFEYGISFENLIAAERTTLANEILELQRREAAARSAPPPPTPPAAAVQQENGKPAQRRRSVRALFAFKVRYWVAGRTSVLAEANDLSTGGLRLVTSEVIKVGTPIAVRFTLPDSVLSVFPAAIDRTEISPFGARTVKIPDNRRPFVETTLKGRIVSRFHPTRGRDLYGVQFTDIDGYDREEIARFTHALQLQRLRQERQED